MESGISVAFGLWGLEDRGKLFIGPGELVYDPFCGLGTVPYRAIKLGRKGQGSELNAGYFFDSLQYLKAMEQEVSMPGLFDALEMEEAAA